MIRQQRIRSLLESVDKQLYSRLQIIETELHKLLEYSQSGAHIIFTPHGISHVAAVEANYDWLLSQDDETSLSPMECFCLLVATIMHDVLMIPRRPGDEGRARQGHATGIDEFIAKSATLGINVHEASAISEIVRAHSVYDLSEITEFTVLGNERVDLRKLGAFLSLADICHADASRAPQIVFEYLSFDEQSAWHWRRHMQIGGITRYNDTIEVSSIVFSDEGADAVEQYVSAIQKQLEIVAPHVPVSSRMASRVNLTMQRLKSPADQELRFTADVSAILQILISGVYESENVFVRELVQNALDATYLRTAMAHRRSTSYEPRIVVCEYREGREVRALRVVDNGIGMDVTDIQDTILLIGGSAANRETVQTLLASTTQKNLIATFGVGLLSCLKVAKRIVITTKKPGMPGVRVEITGLTDPIRTEQSDEEEQGTSVLVELVDRFARDFDAADQIQHYCRMVEHVRLRFMRDEWTDLAAIGSRGELFSEALDRGVTLPSETMPPHAEVTEIEGDGFTAWLWVASRKERLLPWQVSRRSDWIIENGYEGTLLILNDGIFVCETPSSGWLPPPLKLLNGIINLSAKAVDLPVSRDRVVQNDKRDRVCAELGGRAMRVIHDLVRRGSHVKEWRRTAGLVFTRTYQMSNQPDRARMLRYLDNHSVEMSDRTVRVLSEIRDTQPECVYLVYSEGNFVKDLNVFDGKQLYHKEDDVARLQASVLTSEGKPVIECARGDGSISNVRESEVVEAYFVAHSIAVVDLTRERPIEGTFPSRPVPCGVRAAIGPNVKFVELPALAGKRGWRIGDEVWLNVSHPEVGRCYAVLSDPNPAVDVTTLVHIYVLLIGGDFGKALEQVASGIIHNSRTTSG